MEKQYPLDRTPFRAWWDAFMAVRAGVFLEEYQRYRLRSYEMLKPEEVRKLPLSVTIKEGKIEVADNPDAYKDPRWQILNDPAGENVSGDPFDVEVQAVRAHNRVRSRMVLRELEVNEEENRNFSAKIADFDEELHRRTLQNLTQQDSTVDPASILPSSDQFFWLLGALYVGIALCVNLEAWQFAVPFLNVTGIDVSDLSSEWVRNPIGILNGSGFALAVSAGICIVWSWIFTLTGSFYKDVVSFLDAFHRIPCEFFTKTRRKLFYPVCLKGALVVCLLVLMLWVAYGVGSLREGGTAWRRLVKGRMRAVFPLPTPLALSPSSQL